ncbi:MAG TPA: hypothetical protein VH541_05535 [Gaiellaceae bacterium]|jgi:hypothetical protein
MADLTPLLKEVAGIYVDRARDRLPDGSVWQMTDWVPESLQAGVRMRGRWTWQSVALSAGPDGMIYAPYSTGSRLLSACGASLYNIPLASVGGTAVGTIPATKQNPVFHRNTVIIPAASGSSPAKRVTFDGTTFGFADEDASALTGRYACVFKDRLVLGGSAGQPSRLAFSKVGNPAGAWDAISLFDTAYDLTGLAAQRTQVLCFHASSVERLRGTTPPDSTLTNQKGDMTLDVLFDRAGCYDARSIAAWNDNILFCDARGIFLTDGAVVRNVTDQAGMMNEWRLTFKRGGNPPLSVAGVVHQDYYLCCVRNSGYPPVTFVTDLPSRRMFKLSNIDATCFAFSIGTTEELYSCDTATKRVTYLTNMFVPDSTVLQIDDNSTPVLPTISTGWSRLTKAEGFKRIHDMHVAYEAHRDDDVEVWRAFYTNAPSGIDQALGEFRTKNQYGRSKIAVRRRLPGFATTLTQLVPTKDSRLYEISLRAYPEEPSRL